MQDKTDEAGMLPFHPFFYLSHIIDTHMRKGFLRPPLRPAVLLAGRSSTAERAYPPRPQAMEGSSEGRVPLAPSAEDRPPRRRIKRQSPTLTSIYACTKSLPTAPHIPLFSVLPSMHVSLPDVAWHGLHCPARQADNTAAQEAIPAGSPSR